MPNITKYKKTTYKIKRVGLDFTTFDESFRKIRERFKYNGFQCFSCDSQFEDGEKISLIITDKGNKLVCLSCAENFKQELEKQP